MTRTANHNEIHESIETGHNKTEDNISGRTQEHESRTNPDLDNSSRSDNLRDSPMVARMLDALDSSEDIGSYGQFTFVAIARHFLSEEEIVRLLASQPEMDEERARALYIQVNTHDYNPPRRERILEQQTHQTFQIIPDPDDPDMGNVYRELRFPDGLYEHINHYYEGKADSEMHRSAP